MVKTRIEIYVQPDVKRRLAVVTQYYGAPSMTLMIEELINDYHQEMLKEEERRLTSA